MAARARRDDPASGAQGLVYLPPVALQGLGVLLLIGSAVFWGISGRESVLLMSSAMSLIGLGAYAGAQNALRSSSDSPTPPPIAAAFPNDHPHLPSPPSPPPDDPPPPLQEGGYW